jgi:diacylglycerol kinase (ATP)
VIGLLQVAGEARPCYVELAIDGAPAWSGAVYQVSVGNARYHGGGLTVAEQAAIGDGKLDLYVVCPGTFWQLLACITHLKFALAKPDVLHRQSATHVTLCTRRPRCVNAEISTYARGVHHNPQSVKGDVCGKVCPRIIATLWGLR